MTKQDDRRIAALVQKALAKKERTNAQYAERTELSKTAAGRRELAKQYERRQG